MRKLLHTILSVLALVMPLTALAQPYTAEQEEARLVGLSMIPEWAKELANYGGGGGSSGTLYENNVYIKWRNAANSANIDVLKVDATDDTVLNADTGDVIKLSIAGTSEVQIDNDLISYTGTAAVLQSAGTLQLKLAADAQRLITATGTSDTDINVSWGDAGVTAVQDFSLIASTADADDDSRLNLCGGGAVGSARGACLAISGNEDSTAGDLVLTSGAAAGSDVIAKLFATGSAFVVNNSADVAMWDVVESTGVLRNRTGGSDLGLSLTGTTVAIQEATAGSACSGTLTLNGATPVVTSTTCATAGSRIFLTRTSIDADTTGDMAVTALNAGVSFSVTSEANDTATVNWIIFHEAA